ncbi:hypothetical protein D3C76_1356020 [compost metagenome]
MTHVVIHHVVTHRLLCRLLHFAGDGGVNTIAIFVRLLAIAAHHFLADHFREIRGGEGDFRSVIVSINGFVTRLIVLSLADIAFAQHTRQHHVTTCSRAVEGVERVER